MFSRLTIFSISRNSTSGWEGCGLAVAVDAPVPCSRGCRPLPSERAWRISAPSPASIVTIERPTSLRRLTFDPSSPGSRLLRPLLTSAAPSRRLAAPVAHLSPGAGRQISQGKTRDLRAIHLAHLRPHLPGDIGLRRSWPPRPDADASYALPVRQAGTLPAASFRPHLAATPLLFG